MSPRSCSRAARRGCAPLTRVSGAVRAATGAAGAPQPCRWPLGCAPLLPGRRAVRLRPSGDASGSNSPAEMAGRPASRASGLSSAVWLLVAAACLAHSCGAVRRDFAYDVESPKKPKSK